MDCDTPNRDQATLLQVSSGTSTSQDSTVLLDLSAPLDSANSGDNKSVEVASSCEKNVSLFADVHNTDSNVTEENLSAKEKSSNSIQFLDDIEPPSIFFDTLDFSDEVSGVVASQDSDVSSCDSDSGSDWSFLDDEWWKIKSTEIEDSSTTAVQCDTQLMTTADNVQETHTVCESENNRNDDKCTQENVICSDSTIPVCDLNTIMFCVPPPITTDDDVQILESETTDSVQPSVHTENVVKSEGLTFIVPNKNTADLEATNECTREPDSTVIISKEENVLRVSPVECGQVKFESIGSIDALDEHTGRNNEQNRKGSEANVTDNRCFKSRLPSPKVKNFAESPVKCSQLEELRELRDVTFVRPPYTTDTQPPDNDQLPSTTFIKPSESTEPLPATCTTIVIPTVDRPILSQGEYDNPLPVSEDKDACTIDNGSQSDCILATGGSDDKERVQEDLNTSSFSSQSQTSSVSSTASRESKESGSSLRGGCNKSSGVSKSKLPKKSGIPRSTSENNVTKASKPLNKTKIPSRRPPTSKLKKPTASIKPSTSATFKSKSKQPTVVENTARVLPSNAQSSESTASKSATTNENVSSIFDATVLSIRSQPSDVVLTSVQSTPLNHVSHQAIEATPTRPQEVQHIRPTFSLSSIDSEGSNEKGMREVLNTDVTSVVSTPIAENKMQTPNKRKRRSLIPTPSGKEIIVSRRMFHQDGPIPYNCDTPTSENSSSKTAATNQQENLSSLMPPPKTKGILVHGKSTKPTGLKQPKQIRPKGSLSSGVGGGNRGVFKPRNGRVTKPRNTGPLKSQVQVHQFDRDLRDDDLAAMMSRPRIVHSPLDKENRPATPHSKWSPIKRKKPMSFEDACIQCTKRV